MNAIAAPSGRTTQQFFARFEQLAQTIQMEVERKSHIRLSFSLGENGPKMHGSISAIMRTKYAGQIRHKQLLGYRLMMESPAHTEGRMVLAEPRLTSGLTRWLNRYAGLLHLSPMSGISHLEIWCSEIKWAQRTLSSSDIAHHVLSLLPHKNQLRHAVLHWHPDRVLFSASCSSDVLLESFTHWRNDLSALADASERQSKPLQAYKPHWMETKPILVSAIVLTVLMLGILLVGLAVAAVFMWMGVVW